MKKLLLSIFSISILALCTAFYVNYSIVDKAKERGNEVNPLRFTFVAPLQNNPYWDVVVSGMEASEKKLGVNVKFAGQSELNTEEQIEDIETAIASKVDGIITVATNTALVTPVINKAKESGIPVILIDTDAPESKRDGYIGTSNYKAGYDAGMEMIRATKERAVIGIITGTFDASNLNERIEGFRNAISSAGGMKIVTMQEGKSDLIQITEKVRTILRDHADMNAIFCAEGYGAVGAAKVISSSGIKGKVKILGFDDVRDTIAYVKKGVVYGTVVQKPYQMGYLSVKYLKEITEGKRRGKFSIDTGVTIVTKDNVNIMYPNTK